MAYTRLTMDGRYRGQVGDLARGMTALLTLALVFALPVHAQQTSAQATAELEQVRGRINDLREDIQNAGRRRSRAEKALAQVEREEQSVRRELAGIRDKLKVARRRQTELETQLRDQQAQLEAERRALEQQLRVAYINGNEEWLRIALNQRSPTDLGRRITYYGYLSRQRSGMIDSLRALLAELEATREAIAAEARQLAKLEDAAMEKLEDIADKRTERARLVATISEEIESKDAEVARLESQAAELSELVAALARMLPAMPDVDAEPFAGKTASLDWPTNGPVLQRFGQPRAGGGLKWQGVLIGAPAGSDVRAVYNGRVVFSDWLDGMGLLLIVEHGDGYMSLYGHNQDLLKDVGEWVLPGEVIAHVGDSGGRASAGLYFEIRKDGQPVNPGKWIR